jgi:Phage capsid family
MPEIQLSDQEFLTEIGRLMDAKTTTAMATMRTEHAAEFLKFKQSFSRGLGSSALDPATADTMGARFVRADAFNAWRPQHPGGRPASATFKMQVGALDRKAAPITSAGLAPIARVPGVAAFPTPPAGFIDVLNWRPIGAGNVVQFLQQTAKATPGGKTQVLEGDTKAEQTVNVALKDEPILNIAAWTSASTQALDDIGMLQVFIDLVLTTAVLTEIDRQALVGLGPAAELLGITRIALPYNEAANKANDSMLDTLSHAGAQLGAAGVAADTVVLNPLDAEAARLTKTTLGGYIFGSPGDAGAASGIWGLKFVLDAAMPAGSFLVGQSATCELLDRQEAAIVISFEHADFFTRNLCAIRCEARVGLGCYVPAAWVTGTFPVTPPLSQQSTQGVVKPVTK